MNISFDSLFLKKNDLNIYKFKIFYQKLLNQLQLNNNKIIEIMNNKNNQELNINLYKAIFDKDEEIKILKIKLNRFPFELNENEKLLTVIFTTYDEIFYYSIICKNTERFNAIENKLYDVYSDYSNPENNFVFNGRKINKVKTLEQNGIKNNSIIILNKIKK